MHFGPSLDWWLPFQARSKWGQVLFKVAFKFLYIIYMYYVFLQIHGIVSKIKVLHASFPGYSIVST